ncbi:MAG: divergent AAA domain-containing protein, partial [bacterium F083]
MALPINIEDLLNKRKVEGNRIEFKKGWNPAEIYHSICAFANDFDNLGGGYILVGVEENEYGIAKRPVTGINIEAVDGILKKMVGVNNMFDPYYLPRTSVEEVDGQQVLVIWAPSGVNRPYAIPMDVTATLKKMKYYIRSGSSSIVAKGEVLDELRDMANRVPFDERPNPEITLKDISMVLLRDYLATIGSKLEASLFTQPLADTLEQMELLTGPTENRMIKNVAGMMFCERPEKFFPYTQIDIVVFPEGKVKNPHNFTERTFKGSVPQIIKQTMDYLETNILYETVQKVSGQQEANRFWNYPYDAIEEAVVNSMYHRDYQQHEPVEITIEPDGITILNCPGPDRSIPMSAIEKGDSLKSRRYRNRRLGDFLKELDLTEGRSTGVPTIQEKLAANGSPRATFETTEDRLTFLIHIPVHVGCDNKPVSGADVENNPVTTETTTVSTTEKTTETGKKTTEKTTEKNNKTTEKTTEKIVRLMKENPQITNKELADACGITEDGVYWNTKKLRKNNIIRRVGGDKGGHWEVLD